MVAGMNVARLNFSHGDHETHRKMLGLIREVSRRTGIPIGIMQDLQGPKIRLGKIQGGSMEVPPGGTVRISPDETLADGRDILGTTYYNLPADVHPGDVLLVDDGRIRLEVVSVNNRIVTCRAPSGGTLKSSKGINLPGVKISEASPTPRDLEDLEVGLEMGVDFVALSFVRTPEEIRAVKRVIHKKGLDTPVIAKIERPEAFDCLDAIIEEADGILVARGDLGVEAGPHRVPVLQKHLIRRSGFFGKFVITATQMLESMISSPIPTRAEASDVANAILDGSSAIMLSGETAMGQFPVEAVAMMNSIAREVEPLMGPVTSEDFFHNRYLLENAVCNAAVRASELLEAKAIVAFTQSGATAASISKYRPDVCILGASFREETLRRMTILRGVDPILVDKMSNTDEMISSVEELLVKNELFRPGEIIIFTAGAPVSSPGTTNLLKIHRIKGSPDTAGDEVRGRGFFINLDQSRCISCGLCVRECPADIFENLKGAITTVPENGPACIGDGICGRICPTGAIILIRDNETDPGGTTN